MSEHHQVITELAKLIEKHHWEDEFNEAIKKASSYNVPLIGNIKTIKEYLDWINQMLYWIPSEDYSGKKVYDYLCAFYFILNQESLFKLQNKVIPHDKAEPLTPLSNWMVDYAKAMGAFLDTPESFTPESEKSFFDCPNYNMNDYIRPHDGWKTFNQFFARNYKPGYRPIAAISDSSVIVSPADSTFAGQWEIRPDSHVTVKGLHWKISELLEGSPYKDRFTNGMFMHAFLNTTDYHRQHTPVQGKVLESRFIPGQVFLEVEAVNAGLDENGLQVHNIMPKRTLDAPDNAGYQFAQARGLIVIDSPIGLVAILPIGMAQVSSVILTAEEGVTLQKGEEISYFQFGGSDIILLFESASNVSFNAQPGVHYKVGTKIAQAYPAV